MKENSILKEKVNLYSKSYKRGRIMHITFNHKTEFIKLEGLAGVKVAQIFSSLIHLCKTNALFIEREEEVFINEAIT